MDFDRALITLPIYALAYNSRGAAYYSKGDLGAALADFNKAIQLQPDYANAYWNRARLYAAKDNNAAALADFNMAIHFKPQDPELYEDRGEQRSTSGDDFGAIADFNKAIELDPKMSSAFNDRSNSNLALGDIDKALADYDTAIRLTPAYADPYTNRGRIELFNRNRPAEAAQDFATSVRLDPDDIYAALWLHIARVRSGAHDSDELPAYAAKKSTAPWPQPLLDRFLGKATPEGVRHAAANADQNCEADFYRHVRSRKERASQRQQTSRVIGRKMFGR
jgi:lipoprotein NlpI